MQWNSAGRQPGGILLSTTSAEVSEAAALLLFLVVVVGCVAIAYRAVAPQLRADGEAG